MKEHLKQQFNESYANLIDKLDGWVDTFVTNIPNPYRLHDQILGQQLSV